MGNTEREDVIREYDERQRAWDKAKAADPSHNQAELPLNVTAEEVRMLELLRDDHPPTVVLQIEGGAIHEEQANQPVRLIVIDADTDGVDPARLTQAPGGYPALITTYWIPGTDDLSDYTLPDQDECDHAPDWSTVNSIDGEQGVVDVNCSTCGLSGSFRIDNEDINW